MKLIMIKQIFFHIVLLLIFLFALIISKKLRIEDARWKIVMLALFLYLLSVWSGSLRTRWFPSKENVELKRDIDILKQYSYVAQLDRFGNIVQGDSGVGLSTGISNILSGTQGNPYKCDEKSQEKYKQVINKEPKFPFTYYALALCYEKDYNLKKDNFQKAFDIVRITTQVSGHNIQHDSLLQILMDNKNDWNK